MKSATGQKLSDKKVNPTAMRLLVLDYILDQSAALSLSDIEKGLAPADRITIYRTLKTFEKQGIIHIIEDGTGTPKYALCPEECETDHHRDMHVHFYCLACKETFCLPDTRFPSVSLPDNFSPADVSLLVKGTCDKCNTIA